MQHNIIEAPWSLVQLAIALDRSPGAIRGALHRGTFPIKPRRILGRCYFSAADVRSLLEGKEGCHA